MIGRVGISSVGVGMVDLWAVVPLRASSMTMPRWRWAGRSAAVAAACGLAAGSAIGQIELERLEASRPASAERVVRAFDFEEQATNPLEVPAGWFRGQSDPGIPRERAGFPVWNRAVLDYTVPARSGMGSVRLPVEGGSASLMLAPGLVPVFPGADYRVTAWARVAGVEHGAARLVARFLTQAGESIAGSERRSELVRTSGFTPVRVDLMGDHPEAAFIQAELQLLQPRQVFESLPDLAFRIWPQDFAGAAWFDDVSIVQLPRAELTPTGPGGVFSGSERPPAFDVLVRDLAGRSITVRASVRDIDGVVVDRAAWTLGGGTLRERWTPRLDRYGWYEATIEVDSGEAVVGRGTSAVVWMPGGSGGVRSGRPDADRRRFGLVVEHLPEGLTKELAQIVGAVGVGSVTLPVWSRAESAAAHAEAERTLAGLVDDLLAQWRDVTLCLDRPPGELSLLAGDVIGGVPGLLARPESVWGPYTTPYLDRLGQRVRRWQVGGLVGGGAGGAGAVRPGESGTAGTTPTVDPGLLDAAARSLGVLVPGPVVVHPWSSDAAMPAELARSDRGVTMEVVPGTAFPGFGVLAQDWAGLVEASASSDGQGGGLDLPELTLALRGPDAQTLGRRGAAGELARRTIEAWIALAEHERPDTRVGLALIDPWELGGRRGDSARPGPELAVWRTMIEQLAGKRAATRLQTARGIEAWLLVPRGAAAAGGPGGRARGTIVAWRTDAPEDPAPLRFFMHEGDSVHATDIFGNAVELARGSTEDPARVEPTTVLVGHWPVFIDGVDADLIRFLASVRLDPEFVPAQAVTHRHDMVIENPWGVPIRGRLFLLEPGGYAGGTGRPDRSWRIDPRILPFNIGAGESVRIPIDIAFGAGQRAGPSPMVLDVELNAGRSYPLMRFERDIELGLPGIGLAVSATGVPGAGGAVTDVLVRVEVTNSGLKPLDVELLAAAPGVSRAKAFISRLAPGETAVRNFPMPGAYEKLRGQEVAVGLIEPEGKGHLNASARVD